LRELELPAVETYRAYLETHHEEWFALDSFCRISISRFYRDRGVFNYLRSDVLPMLAMTVRANNRHSLRCWSAGCASGEEVYTLNMLWKLHVRSQFSDLTLHIIGTDCDPNMLERARHACYATSSLKDVPRDWLTAAFTKMGDSFCVRPEFRDGVKFVLQDLRHEMPAGQFHLIFCRHAAFTYFDHTLQQATLRLILQKLFPGGVLVTGKQEPLPTRPAELEEYHPGLGIYRKTEMIEEPTGSA
jgi:chemotaxis protein methyltransferase CheR